MYTKLDCHERNNATTPISFDELLDKVSTPTSADPTDTDTTIFCVPLSHAPKDFETSISLLTRSERQRADRFKHEGARRQFILGHGIVHLLLKWYLKNDYSKIEFKETEHHKPYIQIADGSKPLEYNLSHCEDFIAVAIGSRPQGIDIENIRPLKDLEGISRQVFTEKEIETVFASKDPQTQMETFFKFWTCKEAALKASGTGFMKDPK